MLGVTDAVPNLLIDMSAILKQYTESEAQGVGMPLLPMNTTPTALATPIVWYFGPNSQSVAPTQPGTVTIATNDSYQAIQLLNNDSVGKVMVSGSAMTHNGNVCTISSTDNIPVLVSQSGSITTSTQTITTSIQVTPTVLNYVEKQPEQSIVKLNIQVQLSVITNANSAGVSYTQKNLQTTRIVRADGFPVIAGSFVSDQNTPQYYYIPILGQIPVLSYFFSYKNVSVEREVSVLFLTARLLSQPGLQGGD